MDLVPGRARAMRHGPQMAGSARSAQNVHYGRSQHRRGGHGHRPGKGWEAGEDGPGWVVGGKVGKNPRTQPSHHPAGQDHGIAGCPL